MYDDEPVNEAEAEVAPIEETPEFVWRMSTLDGDFYTTSEAAVSFIVEGFDHFDVNKDAEELVVNITVTLDTPGGVTLRFIEPDCSSGDCYHHVSTSDEAQFTFDEPPAGEWTVVVFAELGVATGSYHLDIGQRIPSMEATEDSADEEESDAPNSCAPHCPALV